MEQDRRQEDNQYKQQISRLIEISIALSAELKLDSLLEKVVDYARELTGADAGTLYLLTDDHLHFKILQTQSMNTFQGGTTGVEIKLPPVPLGKRNVSAYAALVGETVKIDDVYESEKFDFTGTRKYDDTTGYRSRSMLVVPMKNHEGRVIGVLQLLNAIDRHTGEVTVFHDDIVALTEALASQAAVAITNAALIEETKGLFEALIKVLAVAVDAKSPYTANHVERVAEFNLFLARVINAKKEGPFADVHFDKNQLEEIRLAGWLHDVGKLTTPEWVMDKSTKLQALFDRIELVKTRFLAVRNRQQPGTAVSAEDEKALSDNLAFLEKSNLGGEFMSDEDIARVHDIAQRGFAGLDGKEQPLLSDDEVKNLTIRKGTLTDEERKIINDHVVNTARMLAAVPFSERLKKVPAFAAQHHEKLNGKGYPEGLAGDQIPLQSRILAVADLYEALSAKDRPYKQPMPIEQVLKIIGFCVKDGEVDPDVVDLLVQDKVYEAFEAQYEARKKRKQAGG